MPVHRLHRITARVRLQQPIAERLTAAYNALEVMEYALRELAFLDPESDFPGHAAAPLHLLQARAALARAPSLTWPITDPPPVLTLADTCKGTAAHALLSLADALVLSLVEITGQADPADQVACLQASLAVQRALNALGDALGCPPDNHDEIACS